jgi:PEP-CTERM motif
MKYVSGSLTAIAALGLAGVGSQANAGLVTVDYNYFFGTTSEVSLDGVTPFDFDSVSGKDQYLQTNPGGYIASTGEDGTDMVDPSLTYDSPVSIVTGAFSVFGILQSGSGYINLAFDDPHGTELYGFATLDGGGGLTSITYSAVPEPSTWALLIAGAGVVGVATRRRRRLPALTA